MESPLSPTIGTVSQRESSNSTFQPSKIWLLPMGWPQATSWWQASISETTLTTTTRQPSSLLSIAHQSMPLQIKMEMPKWWFNLQLNTQASTTTTRTGSQAVPPCASSRNLWSTCPSIHSRSCNRPIFTCCHQTRRPRSRQTDRQDWDLDTVSRVCMTTQLSLTTIRRALHLLSNLWMMRPSAHLTSMGRSLSFLKRVKLSVTK